MEFNKDRLLTDMDVMKAIGHDIITNRTLGWKEIGQIRTAQDKKTLKKIAELINSI